MTCGIPLQNSPRIQITRVGTLRLFSGRILTVILTNPAFAAAATCGPAPHAVGCGLGALDTVHEPAVVTLAARVRSEDPGVAPCGGETSGAAAALQVHLQCREAFAGVLVSVLLACVFARRHSRLVSRRAIKQQGTRRRRDKLIPADGDIAEYAPLLHESSGLRDLARPVVSGMRDDRRRQRAADITPCSHRRPSDRQWQALEPVRLPLRPVRTDRGAARVSNNMW